MSVSSQRGHIAWAIQNRKVGDANFNPGVTAAATATAGGYQVTEWKRHRAESVSLGVNDLYDVLPLEVGGSLFVNSSYKNGAFVAGGARLFSRLQATIGHLIYATAGSKIKTPSGGSIVGATGTVPAATAQNGTTVPYFTRFQVNPADETVMPYVALRKFTPAQQGASGINEYFVDCRVNMLTISVPAMGPIMMEFTVIGRKPEAADVAAGADGSATGDAAFESGIGLAHGCKGEIELSDFQSANIFGAGAASGKFTSAQIMIANNISQPDQQMIIGSYHPDDLVALSRAVQIRLIYKWQDPQLYKKLYYGGGTGSDIQWSPVVGNSPVRISSASVSNIAGTSPAIPYSFSFYAPDVDWTMTPPQLAGNNLLFCEFTGIVKGGNSGASTAPWHIDVVNTEDYIELGAF